MVQGPRRYPESLGKETSLSLKSVYAFTKGTTHRREYHLSHVSCPLPEPRTSRITLGVGGGRHLEIGTEPLIGTVQWKQLRTKGSPHPYHSHEVRHTPAQSVTVTSTVLNFYPDCQSERNGLNRPEFLLRYFFRGSETLWNKRNFNLWSISRGKQTNEKDTWRAGTSTVEFPWNQELLSFFIDHKKSQKHDNQIT